MGKVEHAPVGIALVFQIVDREDRSRPAERSIAQGGVEQHRQQAGGPVVTMRDVGDPAKLEAEVERTAAEEGEAEIVVVVVAPGAGVDLGPAEETLVFEGVDRHLRTG